MIELKPVDSTMLAAMGYDPAQRVLAIKFRGANDTVYHYKDVPAETWDALQSAPSLGRGYGALIRGKFEAEKIAAEPQPVAEGD